MFFVAISRVRTRVAAYHLLEKMVEGRCVRDDYVELALSVSLRLSLSLGQSDPVSHWLPLVHLSRSQCLPTILLLARNGHNPFTVLPRFWGITYL